MSDWADALRAELRRLFQSEPQVWVRAPGRVDLTGSHTDYNVGFVLTLSMDRDTWIAAKPRIDEVVNVHSVDLAGGGSFFLRDIQHDRAAPWTNYVRGVAHVLSEEGFGLQGWDGLVGSTVPIGSGLSSSAALEVATALVFESIGGWSVEPLSLALFVSAG